MHHLSNIYVFIMYIPLFFLHLFTCIPSGIAFQCSRHTSRYRDVPSLTLSSSVVLDVRPTLTSHYDVTHADICHVTFTVRHVLKNSAAGLNESLTALTGAKRRLNAAFCAKSSISGSGGINESSGNDRGRCAEAIFREGLDKNYLVFMDITERVDGETRRIVEFVSAHQPIASSKEAMRDVRKYNCSKCGRKPSATVKPEYSMTVEFQKRLEVHCRISGSPLPLVEWIHNGDVLDVSQKRYKVKQTKRGSRLRIRRALRTDCGEYYCRAVNVLGESTSHSLYVTVSPDVSCDAQHKHPCSQQTYCLNGGTCWILTNVGTEFCQCTNEYEGERCAEKVWNSDSVIERDGASKILPISIIAVVCGATTLIAVFLLIFFVSRRCSAITKTRKETNSRDTVAFGKDYSKLVGDNNGTLPSAHTTQITYTDDQLSVRDQYVQTTISLINRPVSPLIHVQIQSAIIQSPDCMNYRGSGPGLDYRGSGLVGLDHVDSLAPRSRLSAVSTTPGVDLDRFAMVQNDNDDVGLDDVDYHLQELGIRPLSDTDILSTRGNLSPVSNFSPLSALAETPNESSKTKDSQYLNSPGISRYSEVSSPTFRNPSPFRNLSISSQQGPSSPNHKVNSQPVNGSIRSNISNPDILESTGKDRVKENHLRETNAEGTNGMRKENSKRNRNPVSADNDNLNDSDPEATVV